MENLMSRSESALALPASESGAGKTASLRRWFARLGRRNAVQRLQRALHSLHNWVLKDIGANRPEIDGLAALIVDDCEHPRRMTRGFVPYRKVDR